MVETPPLVELAAVGQRAGPQRLGIPALVHVA
jgi:hypothetical protein